MQNHGRPRNRTAQLSTAPCATASAQSIHNTSHRHLRSVVLYHRARLDQCLPKAFYHTRPRMAHETGHKLIRVRRTTSRLRRNGGRTYASASYSFDTARPKLKDKVVWHHLLQLLRHRVHLLFPAMQSTSISLVSPENTQPGKS